MPTKSHAFDSDACGEPGRGLPVLFQPIATPFNFFVKEISRPAHVKHTLLLARALSRDVPAITTIAGGPLLGSHPLWRANGDAAHHVGGLFVFFCDGSLACLRSLFGGLLASNSKYPFLVELRPRARHDRLRNSRWVLRCPDFPPASLAISG